jgi:hypothetical protein
MWWKGIGPMHWHCSAYIAYVQCLYASLTWVTCWQALSYEFLNSVACAWASDMCQVVRLTIYFKFYDDIPMLFHSLCVALNSVQYYKMAASYVFWKLFLLSLRFVPAGGIRRSKIAGNREHTMLQAGNRQAKWPGGGQNFVVWYNDWRPAETGGKFFAVYYYKFFAVYYYIRVLLWGRQRLIYSDTTDCWYWSENY